MKQILFELKKLIRIKFFLYFLIVTALFICSIYLRNVMQQSVISTKKIEQFSQFASNINTQIEGDKKFLEKEPNSHVEARVKVGGTLYSQLKKLMQAIEDGRRKDELKDENNVYKLGMKYQKLGGGFPLSEKDMHRTMDLNNELLKLNLPKEDLNLSIQTSIFMKKVISILLNVLGFVPLFLVLGLLITNEFEDHNIKLVYTLPISRGRYIFVKFIGLLSASIIWLFEVFIVSYALPTIFSKNGVNIFKYPLITKADSFLSSGTFLEHALLMGLCYISFSIALLVFLGFLVRNTIITYIIIIILSISGFIVSNYGWNLIGDPFTYQNINRVILSTPHYYPVGSMILIITMALLLLITLSINQKRGT